jgi:hypothetical protein
LINKCRKELSIVAENGTGSFYGKINKKKRDIKKVTNAREFEHLPETLKEKHKQKPKDSEDMKKEKPSISRIKCSNKKPKNFTERITKNIEAREPIAISEVKPYWKSLWEEEAQLNERTE